MVGKIIKLCGVVTYVYIYLHSGMLNENNLTTDVKQRANLCIGSVYKLMHKSNIMSLKNQL